MIGRLRGILLHQQPPWLVVDVHGVGYELEAPMSTIYDLPAVGQEITLFVHYAQKEDSVSLYGFLRDTERQLFRDVQRVSGIGAKIALAILSGVNCDEFIRYIQHGDIAAITRIPGIGKKTAERMVLELRDKLKINPTPSLLSQPNRPSDAVADAVIALQQLGYKPAEASKMAQAVYVDGDDVAVVIRKALQSALR